MHLPVDRYLAEKKLDLPFCFCWANESWTRRWDGSENEILISQSLRDDDDYKIVEDLDLFFKDARYITFDGKPLLIIYRPHLWSQERVLKLVTNLRNAAVNKGYKGLYLINSLTHDFCDTPEQWGFDAAIEFPPHLCGNTPMDNVNFANTRFAGSVYDMRALVAAECTKQYSYKVFRTVFPAWDNTARKKELAHIFHHSSLALYKYWLQSILEYTHNYNSPTEQFVFINAWNEWAEGAYLEPDRKYGYAYLQATADAISTFSLSYSI